MGSSPSVSGPQWHAFAAVLFSLLAAMTFLGWRLVVPSECAWLPPQAHSFVSLGVLPRAPDGCPFPAGTLVTHAAAADGTARYELQPGDRILELPLAANRGALVERAWQAGGTLLFVGTLFGLCGYAVSRRPHDAAAGSNLVFSAALLGSTVSTVVGLPPSAAFEGLVRWLFVLNVGFVYSLAWGAMLAWALQFPAPLAPRLSGAGARALVTWTPPLAWAVIAGLAGAGKAFPAWMAVAVPVQTAIVVACLTGSLGVTAVRMVRAGRPGTDPVQRQQLVWVGASALVSGVLALALWIVPSLFVGRSLLPEDLIGLPGLVYVAGMGVAMLRYRLFDLDIVLARTLVYASLTLAAVLVYLVTVGVLTALVAGAQPTGVAVAGAVAVAILVNPARIWLEHAVNRAFYGERDDPYRALSRVAGELGARELAWPDVASDLRRALRVPYVAIRADPDVVAEAGVQPASPDRRVEVPLVHGGSPLGSLVLASRGRGERFAPAERRLLADLAVQIGAAVHAERLDREVQATRERLVLAREEERRQLRRTLHDDLGPTMAAIGLRAGTVRQLLDRTGSATEVAVVLDRIEADATRAAEAVRALAYDLRPPALDTGGLEAALREQIAGLQPLQVVLEVRGLDAGALPPLPAAVEAAAYRIVMGALTNTVRHSGAERAWVSIDRGADSLAVTVADDGAGPPSELRTGVGLIAMRERAAELGGSCTMAARPGGGTLVHAELPVGERP